MHDVLEAAEAERLAAMVQRAADIRLAGKVERCHTIPHQGSYNVAAHTWGATMLLHQLFPESFERLVLPMLAHDVGEGWVGDIPATTMRYSGAAWMIDKLEARCVHRLGLPSLDDVSGEDFIILKSCDFLEFYLWLREETNRGNGYVADTLDYVRTRLGDDPTLPAPARRFFLACERHKLLPQAARILKKIAEEMD